RPCEVHGLLYMQHSLVELPELGKAERCIGLGVAVGNSCSGLLENPCPRWLAQPRGVLLGLEPHVALEEADRCAIGAEVPMRISKRISSSDAQHRVPQGFGDRRALLAMLDGLGATSDKAQCHADRAMQQSFAARIVQGLRERLGFELKLNPAG